MWLVNVNVKTTLCTGVRLSFDLQLGFACEPTDLCNWRRSPTSATRQAQRADVSTSPSVLYNSRFCQYHRAFLARFAPLISSRHSLVYWKEWWIFNSLSIVAYYATMAETMLLAMPMPMPSRHKATMLGSSLTCFDSRTFSTSFALINSSTVGKCSCRASDAETITVTSSPDPLISHF